ncbi:MAG TPA: hypothetical protein VMB22_09085, partial [Verrucomicrobiae bacterium]|nr:hypothetical protein [Verrucomicrobiae bacterium]
IAKNILIEKIHFIQSKAKLKYAIGSPVLGEYAVGSRFTISRPALETAGGNVLNKLKGDTLPKVTAQHATDLGAALNNYKNTKVTQQGGKGDITTLKTQLAAQVDSLAERRHKLQVAVDGDFPCTDPANAGVRRKFDLPLDRPLSQ